MEETRENPHYLPGIKLPKELKMIHDMKAALKDASIVVFAVPAQNFRKVFEEAAVYMPSDAVAVNVAKGIEKGSLMRLSQIAMQIKTDVKYAVLSGPSHAEEIARKLPTTVAAASADRELSLMIQDIFNIASSAKMMTRATADNSTDIAILATSGKYAMIAKIQVSIKNRTDYKADFDHGKDITIGGITINNQIYSDADIQILDATDADVALDTYFSATMSKPVILFLTGTAHNFTTTGVKSISNDVIIIGRYDDEQVTLRPINCWKSCKGKLLFKNIKIDLSDLNGGSNAGYFINNAGVISKGDFTDICIDNCLIANVLKPIYYDAAQKTYFGIDNISVQDTRIEVNAIKIALINIYKGFNLGDYKTFNFKNNIVYSQTPQEGVQILNWATGNIPLSDGVLSAEIINNTFVNMIGSNIFFRYQKGTSLTISKNIFDVSPEAEFGSYYYSFLESCTPQIDVTDNIVYGLTKNWNYYHTSSLVKEPTSGNNITKHATAPITQYDYVNGIFTLASDVAGYGATIE